MPTVNLNKKEFENLNFGFPLNHKLYKCEKYFTLNMIPSDLNWLLDESFFLVLSFLDIRRRFNIWKTH